MSHFRKYKSFRFLLLSKWPFISLFFFSSVGHSILSYSWLHCSLGILVPWPRTRPWATVVKVPSLNPWTPREFPFLFFENLWNSLFVLSVLSFQREVSLKKIRVADCSVDSSHLELHCTSALEYLLVSTILSFSVSCSGGGSPDCYCLNTLREFPTSDSPGENRICLTSSSWDKPNESWTSNQPKCQFPSASLHRISFGSHDRGVLLRGIWGQAYFIQIELVGNILCCQIFGSSNRFWVGIFFFFAQVSCKNILNMIYISL